MTVPELKLIMFNSGVTSVRIHTSDVYMREMLKSSVGPLPWSVIAALGTLARILISRVVYVLAQDADPSEDMYTIFTRRDG